MTQSELKELTNLGAELGAAKAEVERLREALRWYEEKVTECRKIGSLGDNARQALDLDGGFRARDALSQQSEPTDTYTAVEMATAAAQGFRDGQAAVDPAQAQGEREAFEARMVLEAGPGAADLWIKGNPSAGYSNERVNDHRFGWVACLEWMATRPAQTEQQPVAVPEDFQPLETIRWWISAYTNPENGPSYQGHGMMVQMLCEYEALRIMLSSRAQQRPTAYPHEAMDKLAADRYRVGAAGAGTLHGFAVRAGDGEQELYRGSKSDCEHVARKLAGAFLDGGFTAFERYAAPIAQTDPWQPSGADYDRAIHANPDAKAWADLFVETFPGLADKHDLMIGWFANAMMAMHDHLARKAAPQPEQHDAEVDDESCPECEGACSDHCGPCRQCGGEGTFEAALRHAPQTEQSGYLPLSLTEILQRYRRDLELRTFPDNDEGDYQLRWTAKEIERVNAALSTQGAPK